MFLKTTLICLLTISTTGLAEPTVNQLQQAMTTGSLTAVQLTQQSLTAIECLNPQLNAVISTNPKALEQAAMLDEERSTGQLRGPLHGIPVLLKDNIETADPMATTAGSLALQNNLTDRDATLVKNLRQAGAVILGKTNLSEWANFRSERSSSGWSSVGGQTHNPYDLNRNPCGSSAGSGVAAAAGLAPLTVGTETNGSIVCPASANGVVGLKPTVGLVSRTGVVPLSHSQDTAGPMTRNVTDAAIMLTAMQGADDNDSRSLDAVQHQQRDYSQFLQADGLKGKRIGVLRSAAGFHSEVDALLEQAIKDLKAGGADIIDEISWQPPEGFWQASYEVLLYEFRHVLNAYLAGLPNELRALNLEQLIAFNKAHADQVMPWFDQEIFVKAQAKGPLTEQSYQDALSLVQQATRADGIDSLLKAHELDVIIAPTGSPAWSTDLINGDHFIGSSSSLAAISGYPNITVPMGQVHGLPVGLSFFSRAFAEPAIIEVAYAYEQATLHRTTFKADPSLKTNH
jgi:amidase